MSKASPPNIPIAEGPRSPSPNSARSTYASSHHAAAVAIFVLFGLAALVPAVLLAMAGARPGGFVLSARFLDFVLRSPSILFVPAMILAGVLTRSVGLLPRGISFSLGRIVGAALIGFLAYAAGYGSIVGAVVTIFGAALSSTDAPSSDPAGVLGHIIGYVTVGGIMFVGGLFMLLIFTIAFAVATRRWPRRAFRWIALLTATAILGGIIAGIIHYKFSQELPNSFIVYAFLADPLQVFFSVAWGIPLVVFVGAPLLAALVGHWLFLAAVEWSTESA